MWERAQTQPGWSWLAKMFQGERIACGKTGIGQACIGSSDIGGCLSFEDICLKCKKNRGELVWSMCWSYVHYCFCYFGLGCCFNFLNQGERDLSSHPSASLNWEVEEKEKEKKVGTLRRDKKIAKSPIQNTGGRASQGESYLGDNPSRNR
jgi:hypothetical protein